MAASVAVEMGEMWVSGATEECLTAVGLGASVGLCLYDPTVRLGAMAHIVLPETPYPAPLFRGQVLPIKPGKCADTAVAYLIGLAVERGARVRHLQAAIVGGSQIFSHSSPTNSSHAKLPAGISTHHGAPLSRLEIGPRNTEAVRAALEHEGVRLIAEDIGGTFGRTVSLHVRTGDVWVRRIGGAEQKLVSLTLTNTSITDGREAVYGR